MYLIATDKNQEIKSFKDEQAFKIYYLKGMAEKKEPCSVTFCIETEETVQGFPDALTLTRSGTNDMFSLYEFKFSDKNEVISFQPSQIAFYRKYPFLHVCVVAGNRVTGITHVFTVEELFCCSSPYYIGIGNKISLKKVEKKWRKV